MPDEIFNEGDQVVVVGPHYVPDYIATVSRVTRTQAMISKKYPGREDTFDIRFQRAGGRAIGGSPWSASYIRKATSEDVEKALRARLIAEINRAMQAPDRVSTDSLRAAHAALCQKKEENNAR